MLINGYMSKESEKILSLVVQYVQWWVNLYMVQDQGIHWLG